MSEEKRIALAIAAHPDDIEFLMAGTLIRLGDADWDLHVMNLASGNLGSVDDDAGATAAIRRGEAQAAAAKIGAHWHPPISRDMEIFYDERHLRRLAAVVRSVQPDLILTHSPEDYMEDHMNTSRLAVSAAFARGMRNFLTSPAAEAVAKPVTIYHAQPHMNRDPLGRRIAPEYYVDITDCLGQKREALSCHQSQKRWLDQSQGMDSYLNAMEDLSREVGIMSGYFDYAEGWRKHLFVGFCPRDADPLKETLGPSCLLSSSSS